MKKLMDDPFHKARWPIAQMQPDGSMIVLYWCRESADDAGEMRIDPVERADADTLKTVYFVHEKDCAEWSAEFCRRETWEVEKWFENYIDHSFGVPEGKAATKALRKHRFPDE